MASEESRLLLAQAHAQEAGHGAAETAAGAHGTAAAEHAFDPMHQFEIQRWVPIDIFGLDASFTNSAFFMVLIVGIVALVTLVAIRPRELVPGRFQSIAELSYEFVAKMVRDNAGDGGQRYFPFIFSLFMFILVANLLGMVPYAFTVTSHIVVTFALAMTVMVGVTVIGFAKHGPGFVKLFVPSGMPVFLLPLLVLIELISYLTRPVSLSVRLFANMLAGHTMLKVFASFVVGMGIIGGWAPLAFMVAFTGLEVLVALLQAYVFAVLTCIYLNDVLHIHH